MKKKLLCLLLTLTVAATMILGNGVCAFGAVTGAKPPAAGALKWAAKPGGAMTPPALYEDKLYVAAGRYVYMIHKDSGAILKKSVQLADALGYTTVPVTCAEGKVFVPIKDGRVDILNAATLAKVHTTEGAAGQTITPITYHNGYIYTGTYTPGGEAGTYMCIRVSDGKTIWKQENPRQGFYWAGAYVTDRYAVFGSEDGRPDGVNGTAKLYSHSATGQEIISELELNGSGDIRSTMVYDGGFVYFTTKGGFFYKVKVSEDGMLTQPEAVNLGSPSTSTPVLYNGKAYVSTGSLNSGQVKVIDLTRLQVTGSVGTPGYIQGEMLLSTAYGTPYLYGACNYPPGGIYLIRDTGALTGSGFFTPPAAQSQYGISPIVCDSSGTVYYSNDSNYLMAVSEPCRITASAGKGGKITGSRIVGKGAASSTFKATPNKYYYVSGLVVDGRNQGMKTAYTFRNIITHHTIRANFKKVATPSKVKAAPGKKKATVKWKKATSINGYQVYRAASKKGKYKKVKDITKSKTVKYVNKKLKKGKTYYYKVRAYKKVGGKKVYGPFSKIVKVKVK